METYRENPLPGFVEQLGDCSRVFSSRGDSPRFLVKSAYVPCFPRNRMRLEEALEVARRLLGKLRRIRAE
jgi:hypothetical protein